MLYYYCVYYEFLLDRRYSFLNLEIVENSNICCKYHHEGVEQQKLFFSLNVRRIFATKYHCLFTYPCVHEDKVHLAEGEDHLQNRIDAPQDLIAGRSPRNFEKGSKFHAIIDHGPKTKGCNNKGQYKVSYKLLGWVSR